jgi:hypothetical protein
LQGLHDVVITKLIRNKDMVLTYVIRFLGDKSVWEVLDLEMPNAIPNHLQPENVKVS